MTDIKITTNTSGSSNTTVLRATTDKIRWILIDPSSLEVVGRGEGTCIFPADLIPAALEAATAYLADNAVKIQVAAALEASKITLSVSNVGQGRDFKRANEYAKAFGGTFDGSSKTWTIRVTPAERADLMRYSLKEVGGRGSSASLESLLTRYGSSDRAWEQEDESAWMTLSSAGY